MIPYNNLSVLPFYTSIDQQNARKWWVYGKVYPLFTPAGFLLPFQVMRKHRMSELRTRLDVADSDIGYITPNGVWQQDVEYDYVVSQYDDITVKRLYFENMPEPYTGAVMAAAFNSSDVLLGTFNPTTVGGAYTGYWNLPAGTNYIYVQTRTEAITKNGVVYGISEIVRPVSALQVYTKNGELVGDFSGQIADFGFIVKPFANEDYDVIVFPGQLPVFSQMDNGQYYVVLGDGVDMWFSEIFTVVNDISGYLKLEWWDDEDFRMDAGTIVYKSPAFKNVLYLCSDIAKPEYDFDDEVIERDGYTFPVKQVSEKRYRFSFLASEFLLDVMRFIRMSDYARITKDGLTWNYLDTFLISPEWEDNGDVAVVDAEFTTGTVAKKNGRGYIQALRGDFNNDFDNDFDNQ